MTSDVAQCLVINALRVYYNCDIDSILADASGLEPLRHSTTSYDIVGGAMHIWPVNLQLL
jgi:hypothetical protein